MNTPLKTIIQIIFIHLLFISFSLYSQVNSEHIWVDGYVRQDGTYVRGHYKTKANTTINDNFTTSGNINPYTGKEGWIPKESEDLINDEKNGHEIPKSYIYPTKDEFKLKTINSLNIFTLGLNKHHPINFDRPYWILIDDTLHTQLGMDVFEADEKHFSKMLLAYYFLELENILEQKGIFELLADLGLKKIKIETPNHTNVFDIEEIKKTNLKKD